MLHTFGFQLQRGSPNTASHHRVPSLPSHTAAYHGIHHGQLQLYPVSRELRAAPASSPRACAARAEGVRVGDARAPPYVRTTQDRAHAHTIRQRTRVLTASPAPSACGMRMRCTGAAPAAAPRIPARRLGVRKVKRRRHVHAQRATQGGSSRRSRPISPFVCPPAAACRHVGWQRRLPELPCSRQSWAWRSGSLADRNGRR